MSKEENKNTYKENSFQMKILEIFNTDHTKSQKNEN